MHMSHMSVMVTVSFPSPFGQLKYGQNKKNKAPKQEIKDGSKKAKKAKVRIVGPAFVEAELVVDQPCCCTCAAGS